MSEELKFRQFAKTKGFIIEDGTKKGLNIDLLSISQITKQDAIIIAVGHREYCNFRLEDWRKMLKPNGVIIDVKSLYDSKMFSNTSFSYWSL